MIRPNLLYWANEIFTPFLAKTWSQRRVASEPKGVILGPKLQPIIFA